MVTITRNRTLVSASEEQLHEAREAFERSGYVRLPALLDAPLRSALLNAVDRITFERRVHEGIGVEECAPSGAVSGVLEFLLNDPELHGAISALTGCGPIGCFEGRLYRMAPHSEHYDSWHSDVGQDRLLALSINLGREPFEGGVLQIRRADSPTILAELANRTAGDGLLFRVHSTMRHRVGPVEGTTPRTAYAGWFRANPSFRTLLQARLAGSADAAPTATSHPF